MQGELLIDKALALGVPKGPLLGQLKAGHSVQLEDGTIIESSVVTSPPQQGFTVAILGDTKYCENSIRLAQNADIVVHEATFDHSTIELAGKYGHATNTEAAKIAKEAQAKHLLLNHISARFLKHDLIPFLEEAKAIFENSYLANDFSQYEWRKYELLVIE